MRILLLVLLSVATLSVTAQAIQDFPDFRSKRDNLSRCPDPVIKHDLIFFTLAGLDQRVGQPQATSLPVTASGSDFIQFSGSDVQVVIRGAEFEQGKRKLGYIDKHLVRIDNKPYFGNYGVLPTEAIQSVTMITGRDTVHVPAAAFADLYQPLFMGESNTTHDGVYLSPDKHTVYIYMLNKEVNGYYEVTWVIRDKQFIRRIVDTDI
ncbi:hypothetical protein [Dinghuibacter silviterrae]|uniref:Uncharacterized protein n=1 Tax=Dinghuibacter silviterrae TaxID=1539049 RepID=A0A4R8DW01_9BACT|nr:hypothetical protein [Dinghuibacter silviterrae]TDX02389.1 hypothetical protein EDB95_3447 [Dinghuibacter silviterrae]